MRFILSFFILSALLSASTSWKLGLGHAALTPTELCKGPITQTAPIQCDPPTLHIPTQPTINCDKITSHDPITVKCTAAPVICRTPNPPIKPPNSGDPGGPCDPTTPGSPTPEPASYALVGAGLVAVGLSSKFRNKK